MALVPYASANKRAPQPLPHPVAWKAKLTEKSKAGLVGAILSTVLASVFAFSPVGSGLVHLSYDLLQPFTLGAALEDVAIIGLEQPTNRAMHALIIDRLTEDGASLVVSDIFLLDEGVEESNQQLAQAIGRNGRVVLAGDYEPLSGAPEVVGGSPQPPRDEFRTNAMAWGLGRLLQDRDGIVRRHYPESDRHVSLAWAAAVQVKDSAARALPASRLGQERWMNYYGRAGAIRRFTQAQATNQLPGFFAEKSVFLSGLQKTVYEIDGEDESPTPFTRWDGRVAARVEIVATTFLNLTRGDWLSRWAPAGEFLLFVTVGMALGMALNRVKPMGGAGLAVGGMVLAVLAGLVCYWQMRIFFPWAVVAGVQIPCAWVCSLVAHLQRRLSETVGEVAGEEAATRVGPVIPDHLLHYRIGEGAYGEVWLATNAVGILHAVKIVHRSWFTSDDAYEREFRGIKKFMPISTSHRGLLNILHVGRNDQEGYYFYIMEAGDSEESDQPIDPARYTPKNLAREISQRGALPPAECLSLMLDLTDTVDYLHGQQLIHRDIKPANVVYVKGKPKLADIGLVRHLAQTEEQTTAVGTDGYLLWEEAGTVQADLYALGKLLYVMLSGLRAQQFPELPSGLAEGEDYSLLSELNDISWKACGMGPSQRYPSAAELLKDLRSLQKGADS